MPVWRSGSRGIVGEQHPRLCMSARAMPTRWRCAGQRIGAAVAQVDQAHRSSNAPRSRPPPRETLTSSAAPPGPSDLTAVSITERRFTVEFLKISDAPFG